MQSRNFFGHSIRKVCDFCQYCTCQEPGPIWILSSSLSSSLFYRMPSLKISKSFVKINSIKNFRILCEASTLLPLNQEIWQKWLWRSHCESTALLCIKNPFHCHFFNDGKLILLQLSNTCISSQSLCDFFFPPCFWSLSMAVILQTVPMCLCKYCCNLM